MRTGLTPGMVAHVTLGSMADPTLTLDKPAGYHPGETITLTLSGDYTRTTTETLTVNATLTTDSGATGELAAEIPLIREAPDPTRLASVTGSDGATWTVAPGGRTATRTA